MDGQRTPHPIRVLVAEQGRTQTWLAKQLGISANYLHRLLLPSEHSDHRPAPDWFYPRIAQVLGVSESDLYPEWEARPAA